MRNLIIILLLQIALAGCSSVPIDSSNAREIIKSDIGGDSKNIKSISRGIFTLANPGAAFADFTDGTIVETEDSIYFYKSLPGDGDFSRRTLLKIRDISEVGLSTFGMGMQIHANVKYGIFVFTLSNGLLGDREKTNALFNKITAAGVGTYKPSQFVNIRMPMIMPILSK